MSSKPRVLVDVDGVLADFLGGALPIMNRLSGLSVTHKDVTDWDIFKAVDKKIKNKCFKEFAKKGFCANLKVIPGAKEGMAKLAEVADIYIVTSPMDSLRWPSERNEWLERHFGITRKKIVHAHCKHVMQGNFLVDDKPSNIQEWAEHNPSGVGVMWAAPYNVDAVQPINVIRTGNWDKLVELVSWERDRGKR